MTTETVIWTDASGEPCEKDQATGGEVLETLPDGSLRSTIFRMASKQVTT